MSTTDGPQLESLLRRLGECPVEFLLPPLGLPDGVVDVAAIACDQLLAMGASPDPAEARRLFTPRMPADANRVRLVAVAAWLLHDEWFLARGPDLAAHAWRLMTQGQDALARVVPAPAVVNDPDRREEFVRLCLAGLGLRPAGETPAQAADRLNTLDSAERDRVVRQTRAAEERARQVREAMAAKAAAEAAARYSPE
jgi:hypothetical protein